MEYAVLTLDRKKIHWTKPTYRNCRRRQKARMAIIIPKRVRKWIWAWFLAGRQERTVHLEENIDLGPFFWRAVVLSFENETPQETFDLGPNSGLAWIESIELGTNRKNALKRVKKTLIPAETSRLDACMTRFSVRAFCFTYDNVAFCSSSVVGTWSCA